MIPCAQFDEMLRESVSGVLAPAQRAEFERHLTECASCLATFRGYVRARTMAVAAYPTSDEPTGPLPDALVRSIVAYVRKGAAGSDAASGVA